MVDQPKNLNLDKVEKHEFVFTDKDFNFIRDFAYKITGIVLTPEKKVMVYARLSRRLRELKLHSFAEYCRIIGDPNAPEITHLINALTTNLTKFFREPHHFDFLKDTILERYKKEAHHRHGFKIWSAGCSSGEEPYSIAMVAADTLNAHTTNFKILATDIDTEIIETAQSRVYKNIDDIPKAYAQKFCDVVSPDTFRIKQSVKDLIHFKRLNLLEPWPMHGQFDVIFCRNVIIYFDKKTQIQLFDKFANILAPNGWLFIGHSENLHHVSSRFHLIGKTIYQKVE